MLYLLAAALLFLVFLGPQLWARGVLRRHAVDRPDFPGTGGELARHLLDEAGLREVRVEATPLGDHYDPSEKAVRLSRQNLEGRSLTAVVAAAHEVGHALQDRDAYRPLVTRTKLVKRTLVFQRIGSGIVLASMAVGMVSRSPAVALTGLLAGIATMAVNLVIHLVTLPMEFDASFARALPVLDRGGYLPKSDLPAARRILGACALTYVAGALMSLLNVWRWIRFFR